MHRDMNDEETYYPYPAKEPGAAWYGNPGPPAAQSYRDYTPEILDENEFVICPKHNIAYARKFSCSFCNMGIGERPDYPDDLDERLDDILQEQQEHKPVRPPESESEKLCYEAYFALRSVPMKTEAIQKVLEKLREAVIFR